jgi:hypothetical protein
VATSALLILVGALWLTARRIPAPWAWVGVSSWPLIVVGAEVLLLIIGLLSRVPGMVAPAFIVGGIGCLLWWQNGPVNWGS